MIIHAFQEQEKHFSKFFHAHKNTNWPKYFHSDHTYSHAHILFLDIHSLYVLHYMERNTQPL